VSKQAKSLVVAGIVALLGMLILLFATRPGIGVLPDSTVYFDAARNLAGGRGLYCISGTGPGLQALTHYPPLYSSLLALIASQGATVETSARWLNVILFAGNILLVGVSLSFCRPGSFWLPVFGSLLAMTAPDLLAIHSVAMTEPLYLCLTFAGLLSLAIYLEKQRRVMLLFAACLIALSFLSRFVGVTGVGAGFIALLFIGRDQNGRMAFSLSFRGEGFRRRVFDAVIFGMVACVPTALWSIRNRLATGGASDRQFAIHPIKFRQIVSAFSTAAQWLLLGKVRLEVRFVAFVCEMLVFAVMATYLMRKGRRRDEVESDRRTSLLHLLTIFIVVYVTFLILIISFFETDNVLDSRSLLPVHFALLVLVPAVARSLYGRVPPASPARMALVAVAVLLFVSYGFRAARWFDGVRADAQGFAGRAWRESPGIAQVRKLPPEYSIYSNGVDAIYYLTGRRAFDIPARMVKGTGQPNTAYEAELHKMSDDLRMHHGVLIYFNTLSERWFLPLESDLKSALPLADLSSTADASFYELRAADKNQSVH